MPTFTGNTFANFYKNLLGINQSINRGVDGTVRAVHDGAGNPTSISLSTSELSVTPITSSTATFKTTNVGGSSILAVDTTNSKVLVGASQVAANTQYATFGVGSGASSGYAANTHYPIYFNKETGLASIADVDFGTGTDPDDSFTTGNVDTQYSAQIVPMIWLLPDNITINSVRHIEGADLSTGDTTRMHLKSFDFTSGSTSCLANGTLLAHSADITNGGNEQAYIGSWTVDSADVDANKAILCFFRQDGTNADYTVTVTIKYFIR